MIQRMVSIRFPVSITENKTEIQLSTILDAIINKLGIVVSETAYSWETDKITLLAKEK